MLDYVEDYGGRCWTFWKLKVKIERLCGGLTTAQARDVVIGVIIAAEQLFLVLLVRIHFTHIARKGWCTLSHIRDPLGHTWAMCCFAHTLPATWYLGVVINQYLLYKSSVTLLLPYTRGTLLLLPQNKLSLLQHTGR